MGRGCQHAPYRTNHELVNTKDKSRLLEFTNVPVSQIERLIELGDLVHILVGLSEKKQSPLKSEEPNLIISAGKPFYQIVNI